MVIFFVRIRFLNFYSEYQRLLILKVINIGAGSVQKPRYILVKRLYLKRLFIKSVSCTLGCHGKPSL